MLLIIIILFAFIIGAAVGSFLNVVILRLPSEGESIVFPASRCPKCRHTLQWYDNIPIVSFLLLKKRCRYCEAPISWQYPLVELTMALLSVALLFKFGLTVALPIYFLFSGALLAVIVIDFYHQIIPDVISLPGIVIGFGCSFVNPVVTWQQAGLGLLIGGGALYAVAAGYYLFTKREGMGGGDIKMMAMVGAFLGPAGAMLTIFLGALAGTLVFAPLSLKTKKEVPFGVFLGLGAAIAFLFGEALVEWYSNTVFGTV